MSPATVPPRPLMTRSMMACPGERDGREKPPDKAISGGVGVNLLVVGYDLSGVASVKLVKALYHEFGTGSVMSYGSQLTPYLLSTL